MNSLDFCYWLRGFLELSGDKEVTLSEEQVKMINDHLALAMQFGKLIPGETLKPYTPPYTHWPNIYPAVTWKAEDNPGGPSVTYC